MGRRAPEDWPITDAEAATRINLAALYRLSDHYGWSDLIYNHISARVPGEDALLVKRTRRCSTR